MDKRKLPPGADGFRRDVFEIMLKDLEKTLERVKTRARRGKFKFAITRGTLTSVEQWRNEIHSNSPGFGLVSKKSLHGSSRHRTQSAGVVRRQSEKT